MTAPDDDDEDEDEDEDRGGTVEHFMTAGPGGVRLLKSRLLDRGGVAHGFFLRTGGVSPPPFDSLNFSARDGDPPENVSLNLERASGASRAPLGEIVTVRQVHGDGVLTADGAYLEGRPPVEADAVTTAVPGVPVGVLTADCLPVLLFDASSGAVAAVHAGWRGTAAGVAARAVERMQEAYSSRPAGICAALGPAIGPCCYTVGADVVDAFRGAPLSGGASGLFSERGGKTYLDLVEANRRVLTASGVPETNIERVSPCTSCDRASFFSYRRESGRGEKVLTGRHLSFIMA